MLTKIHKTKKLGLVFADFSWSATAPAFRTVNLIYGWNGCGKTTLTRLFDEIAASSKGDIEYEVEGVDGAKFGSADTFPTPLRVFNQDYVQNNVRILESSANTISVLLGEQNKDLVAQIETDERDLFGVPGDTGKPSKVRELDGYTKKKLRKEKENETAFSDIARTIGAAIVGSGTGSRTYRSPDAKREFAALSAPVILSNEKLDVQILALKQEMLPELEVVALSAIAIDGSATSPIDLATGFLATSRELCSATVESEIIVRLRDNSDISEWVEQGLHIHKKHSSATCEYCGNAISPERLSQLAKHFSDADRLLKARIDDLITKLRSTNTSITQLTAHDPARFYRELRTPCETAVSNMEKAKTFLISQVTALGKALQDKKTKTGEIITLDFPLEVSGLVAALVEVNRLVGDHNLKSKDFQTLQNAAVKEIKAHYLSTIFEDVSARNVVIADLEKDLERRIKEIKEVKARITDARAKISSTHKACEQINDSLKTFLGRDELRFAPETKVVQDEAGIETEIVSGYRIMRGTAPASYLSEGEKTAIAFVYFVVHLNDGQFQKATGIVVIDDPISSLDSNSLYQAFSFLKNAVADCLQVFVLTHNFDFLKLLLNWRRGARKRHTGFYMIRNHFVGAERRASIEEMDRELKDYESEYHYLFKRLKEMRAEQDGTLMRAYPVPNIARKVWDTFLMFRVPDGQDNYSKMDQLKEAGFDAQKLDAIYKFTNSQSHITGGGFDPSLVPETQKVLDELFGMIKLVSPEHFAILDKATA